MWQHLESQGEPGEQGAQVRGWGGGHSWTWGSCLHFPSSGLPISRLIIPGCPAWTLSAVFHCNTCQVCLFHSCTGNVLLLGPVWLQGVFLFLFWPFFFFGWRGEGLGSFCLFCCFCFVIFLLWCVLCYTFHSCQNPPGILNTWRAVSCSFVTQLSALAKSLQLKIHWSVNCKSGSVGWLNFRHPPTWSRV